MTLRIMRVAEVTSTQEVAADCMEAFVSRGDEVPPLLAVSADYQVAGRGRLDRRWEAEPGQSLLLTVAVDVDAISSDVPESFYGWFTLIAARLLVQAIDEELGEAGIDMDIGIKWPNDILVGGKKMGGVLGVKMPLPRNIVLLGCGVNVLQRTPPCAGATSLRIELEDRGLEGRIHDYSELRRAIETRYCGLWLEAVRWLSGLLAESSQEALRKVRRFVSEPLISIGQYLTVELPDASVVEGEARRLDLDGALVLRVNDPDVGRFWDRRVTVGEIVHAFQQVGTG